ncbi:MAG: hypothetical protein CM15mP103_08910 [Gammaproteobacteria bacterium]|nr:MAG: hypothetical protein CM15mP103_08910 [Gammaproteobacteria bacterium]
MTGATVHQLFRYPVKSMMGEALDTVEVGTSGLEGDRIWAVRDEKRGVSEGEKDPATHDPAGTHRHSCAHHRRARR